MSSQTAEDKPQTSENLKPPHQPTCSSLCLCGHTLSHEPLTSSRSCGPFCLHCWFLCLRPSSAHCPPDPPLSHLFPERPSLLSQPPLVPFYSCITPSSLFMVLFIIHNSSYFLFLHCVSPRPHTSLGHKLFYSLLWPSRESGTWWIHT